ncbi:MAG: S8 family peptidase [Patescibacteria group bacterium]
MPSLRKFSAVIAVGTVFLSTALPVFARTPNDPFFSDQWYLDKIQAPSAWDTSEGAGVIVAVLDTGVDLDHPDLVGNLWKNSKEIPGNGADDDGNGYIDDVNGWDFVDDDNDPTPTGGGLAPNASDAALSHGTLIAGIIGAQTNNAIGYAGIDWHAKIMPLRILDEAGAGGEGEATAAINYAVKNGAKVINLSFVGDESGPALKNAVENAHNAGVVIVAALGNDGRDVNIAPVYPACYRSDIEDWVIGVTATDENDTETEFTNFGSNCADLSAPGTGIQGLGLSDGSIGLSDAQSLWDGTSAASPMVAGAVALILSVYPDLTPNEVRSAIKLSVDPIYQTVSGSGALGVGRLNVAKSLTVAGGLSHGAPPIASAPTPVPTAKPITNTDDFLTRSAYSFIALGAKKGEPPLIRVYKANGTPYAEFMAYAPAFLGGVHVAVGDLDGDGIPEIVAGAGAGGGPNVRVFTASGALIRSFMAYDPDSRAGVSVALGDWDGDKSLDILTSVGAGVSDDVIVYGLDGIEKFRFTASGYSAGIPLTAILADVDEDFESEFVVAPRSGEPRVSVYDNDGKAIVAFLAYAQNMTAGISLSAGDLDGDSRDEIVVSPGNGGSEHIRAFNKIGSLWGDFIAASQTVTTGAVVSVTDIDVDGQNDIVVAPAGGSGNVRVFGPHGKLEGIIGTNLVGLKGTELSAW